jgi:putative alpha-1,2-mannosidase
MTLSVAGNKTLQITTEGLDEGPYIQSIMVNGKDWYKSWVSHEDLVGDKGGSIHFALGRESREWDTGELPPSPGHLDLGIRN